MSTFTRPSTYEVLHKGVSLETTIDGLNAALGNVKVDIEKSVVTKTVPPTAPTIGNEVKAVFAADGKDFYVVTRKANRKSDHVMMRFTNSCSVSDSANYGGESNLRLGSVQHVTATVGKLVPQSKSNAQLTTFTDAQIQALYGIEVTSAGNTSVNSVAGDYSLGSPQVYRVLTNGTLVYRLSSPRAIIRFARSNGSSQAVKLSISQDNTNWILDRTISTQLTPAGALSSWDVAVDGLSNQDWYLKVENGHANDMYVVGLNIGKLGGLDMLDYDNLRMDIKQDVEGAPSNYLGGLGANEFAAKELSTGKFFGTFHGGHKDFLQRLRTETASYNLETGTAPVLAFSRHVYLHSASTIEVGATTYGYTATNIIGDGVVKTDYGISLQSGQPIVCERVYTHMSTTQRNFNWIHLPITLRKEDDGDVAVGQTGFLQQYRAADGVTINCYFTQVSVQDNPSAAYVSFQPNYNKQYYGPALGAAYKLVGGMFATYKEFF